MRNKLAVYLLVLFSALVIFAARLVTGNDSWTAADWMINYQGGFVRRGLVGQLIHIFHLHTGIRSAVFVALIGLALYVVIFYCTYSLLKGSSWRPWVVALVISPATLAFPVLVGAGFHKEIMLIAGLGVLLLMLRGGVGFFVLTIYLSILGVAIILTHEPMIFYLPYWAAALFIALPWRRAALLMVVPGLLSLVAACSVMTHMGDVRTRNMICESLDSTKLCGGSVSYIGVSREVARAEVIHTSGKYNYPTNYTILSVIALLPIAFGFHALWPSNRYSLRILLVSAFISAAGSTELFIYATDWGRWIYIHVMCLFLVLIFVDGRSDVEVAGAPMPWYLLPYALVWALPGYSDVGRFGYFSLAARAFHHLFLGNLA